MFSSLRPILSLLIGVALMALANGLQSSLIGIQAALADFSTATTGIIASGYSIGLFLSSFFTPRLVAQVGHIRVFAAYASILSTSTLLIPVWIDPSWWFAMRLTGGICTAGLYIVIESWLNAAATNRTRGQMLSVYMILIYGGMGLGNLLLNVDDTSGFIRFIIVSALMSIALVPVALSDISSPGIGTPRRIRVREIFAASPLAVVGTFANGLGQSAFFNLGAVYAVMSGLSLAYVSLMMALPPIAVIFSQLPIGWLSDRYDRRRMIILTALAASSVAFACIAGGLLSQEIHIALFAVFGAIALPVYSLALAHANDKLHPDQMLAASSKLVLIYGAGSIAGPSIAGTLMEYYGASGFMLYLGLTYGLLAIYAIWRLTRVGPAADPSATGELVQITPMTMAVSAAAVAEEMAGSTARGKPTEP